MDNVEKKGGRMKNIDVGKLAKATMDLWCRVQRQSVNHFSQFVNGQ